MQWKLLNCSQNIKDCSRSFRSGQPRIQISGIGFGDTRLQRANREVSAHCHCQKSQAAWPFVELQSCVGIDLRQFSAAGDASKCEPYIRLVDGLAGYKLIRM